DIKWQVDAVELAIILGAVLKVIDRLQGRTKRVGISPGRSVLAMHIEDETPHRHRRVAAIVHELIPIRVAAPGHVLPEGGEEVERMGRCKARLRQNSPQRQRSLSAIRFAKQRVLEGSETYEFLLL